MEYLQNKGEWGKTMNKQNFYLQMQWVAPIWWLKYTTHGEHKYIVSTILGILLYRNIFTHVVYLDQLLGACQVCIFTGSWVPL